MAVKSGGGGGGKGSAIRAGRAFVELGADDSGLRTVLTRAKSLVLSTGKALAIAGGTLLGLGGGVLGTVGKAFQETVQHFDEVKKASDRLGTSAESISALGYAASQSGSDMAELESAAKNLQKNLANGSDGFKEIGLDAEKLKGMKLEDQFAAVADAIASMGEGEQGPAAMELMGKAGARMVPMLKNGAAGIKALVAEAGKVGSIVSGEDAEAAERAGDAIDRAWISVKNTFLAVGASMLPQIERLEMLSAIVVDLVGQVRTFISDNRELVVGIAAAAGVAVALGAAFVGIGTTLAVLSVAAGGFGVAITAIGGIMAAVFNPVTLIVGALAVAVAAMTAAVIADFGDHNAALELASFVWAGLLETFQKTWGGISDALAAGDLKLALKVGLAGLDVIWQGALLGMTIAWNIFKAAFVDTFHDGVTGIELLWNDAGAAIQQVILSVLQTLAENFSEFFTKVLGTAADVAEAVGMDSLAGDLRVIQEVGPGVFAEAKKLTEEQRAADEKAIKAKAELAQADRNAARAADALAQAMGLAAAKAELEAVNAEARIAANTKEFADHMKMMGGPVNFGKQQAAIAGMSSLVSGGFGAGLGSSGQSGSPAQVLGKKQLGEMQEMNEKLGKIEKKVGGFMAD